MTAAVTPVIMSGGAGTRLWPTSRAASPKQLHRLGGDRTLLQGTLDRVAPGPDGLFGAPVVVCNERYADQVRSQLAEMATPPTLLLEPFGRNTAAVAASVSAWMIAQRRPDGLVLLAPADHLMASAEPLREAVRRATPAALDGRLVTFGIKPTRPETGYGYIRLGAPLGAVFEAAAFVEKPDVETAQGYIASGEYVWNAGYFLFRADAMMAEIQRQQPQIGRACEMAVRNAAPAGLDALLLDADALAACPSDSIDYAIMEKAASIAIAPMDAQWSDLGSWEAVWEASEHDALGNAATGPGVLVDSKGCLVSSDGPTVAICGLDDIAVIVSNGAVLVVPRHKSQQVKSVVEALKAAGRSDLL